MEWREDAHVCVIHSAKELRNSGTTQVGIGVHTHHDWLSVVFIVALSGKYIHTHTPPSFLLEGNVDVANTAAAQSELGVKSSTFKLKDTSGSRYMLMNSIFAMRTYVYITYYI